MQLVKKFTLVAVNYFIQNCLFHYGMLLPRLLCVGNVVLAIVCHHRLLFCARGQQTSSDLPPELTKGPFVRR